MIFHVKLLLYDIMWWYSMLNYCYMNVLHDCYMVLYIYMALLYVVFELCWIPPTVTQEKMSRRWKSWCLQPRFIHQTLAHQRGGNKNAWLKKMFWTVLRNRCSVHSEWQTFFFGEGQLLGDSRMVNPYTIHNSKKTLILSFHIVFIYSPTTKNNHIHKSMWRGGEDDGESWWWMMMGCHRQTKINDQKAFDLISHCHIICKRYICGP